MEFEACVFMQYNKGNFLYSSATLQLTMDSLPKALEDGIVDSPPSPAFLVAMNLPSPLLDKAMVESS